MAGLPPGDPQLVSMIVNHLKTQGLFDQFRRECLADVDTKPAYLNLKQRVDNFVSNHLSNHTWSPHLNKNQLRNNIRQLVLQSGMLEQGVDRIVAQVVDPKINHIFRPQVERVVREFLSPGTCAEEPPVSLTTTEAKADSIPEQASSSSPPTTTASSAMSILDAITTLSQEASMRASFSSEKGHKSQLSEEPMDIDDSEQDMSSGEGEAQQDKIVEYTEDEKLTSKVQALEVKSENSQDQLEQSREGLKVEVKKEEDESEAHEEATDDKDDKDKSSTRTASKPSVEKQDEELKTSSQAKQKAKERMKEEYSLEDSDLEGLSDITVSSVHTSDLSSFEEESDEAQSLLDSSEEGELQDDEKKKEDSGDGEEKQKPRRKAYVHKPFLYSRYYSDSDDEVTVEERRRSAAKDKEERLLKRQQNRERLEEKRKQKAAQTEEENKKNQKSGDAPTSVRPRAKEARKERKVLEKKMALKKRKLDSRKEGDVTSKKKEAREGFKKAEVKPATPKPSQQKLMRQLSESASPDERGRRMSGSVSEDSSEPKKISDKSRTHSFILELEQGSQEALKYRSISKFDRPSRKERKDKERSLSDQRAKLKHKQTENVQKEGASVKTSEEKKPKNRSEKRTEREASGDVTSKDVKKVKPPSMEPKAEKDKVREKEKDTTKDKAKGEKTKTDFKLLRPDSTGFSEDRSDLDPGSDSSKKKDKHPKEVLKRSRSHIEEKIKSKTESKDGEKEKTKTNDPQKISKSGFEAEKDPRKVKVLEKEKSLEKPKIKSKEESKSPVVPKADKKSHSVDVKSSAGASGVKADPMKEKKKGECTKEHRKEETLKSEIKSSKKKTEKNDKDLEKKDGSQEEQRVSKEDKLEKTKSPKPLTVSEEQQKKAFLLPDTSTDSEPVTTTVTTSLSDDTFDALSDITPEASEGETDPGPGQMAALPENADALLTLMDVCTSADARLPEPSDQEGTTLDMSQQEADLKMKEAALTLLSMDPDSTVSSSLIGQGGKEKSEVAEQMETSTAAAENGSHVEVSAGEAPQNIKLDNDSVTADVSESSAVEASEVEMSESFAPQVEGKDTTPNDTPRQKEEDLHEVAANPEGHLVLAEEVEENAEGECVPLQKEPSKQEHTEVNDDGKPSEEEEMKKDKIKMVIDGSEVETEEKPEVTVPTAQAETVMEEPGSVAKKPQGSSESQSKLVKQSSFGSSADSQEDEKEEKEETVSGRGRRKRKLSTRKASESGDGKEIQAQPSEENVEVKSPRRGRSSRTTEELEKDQTEKVEEMPARRGRCSAAAAKGTADDTVKAENDDKVDEEKAQEVGSAPDHIETADSKVTTVTGKHSLKRKRSEGSTEEPALEDDEKQDTTQPEISEEHPDQGSVSSPSVSQTANQEESKEEISEKQDDTEEEEQPEEQGANPKRRRGRPPKATTSTEDSEKKDEKPEEEEEREQNEEEEDVEKDGDEKDTATRATTRLASRLEAERNKPSKPSTRASRQSGKEETAAGTRSGTRGQAAAGKGGRKREASPPVVRTRGAQKSEEPPSKRAKR